ncbi:MAG TPA: APC family permease [Ktedonobacteraceae bacterium]|nr:APC family permease [Ktedonobacteraceae bacterium]
MAQDSVEQRTSESSQDGGDEQNHGKNMLGPLLCWAVVFADIGTSVYYVPGILYNTRGVGSLAGFFVFLTMSVFVLLTLKYAEVTHRFPQGGGVVTVAAQAINRWVGALGGMFILVDYFLTAAISCLSGMLYLSIVAPAIAPIVLEITIVVLVLLGILNWVGISESAKVSLVGALIAFASDVAILITVFTHISFSYFLSLFPKMFENHVIGPTTILIGFAGSFLAFSGLESISQLSPVMKVPRKRVAGIALLLVVLTIGLTSPLLTMLSTLLLPRSVLESSYLSTQVISLLGGKWGGIILQTEVAISASALLVFASNTAIIGSYHVFIALSRMEFFPVFVLKRNKLRGTPHYSIALATGIPIIVLIIVHGDINILGDMYAFGLLGAFTLTCLGLDIVRSRERKVVRILSKQMQNGTGSREVEKNMAGDVNEVLHISADKSNLNGAPHPGGLELDVILALATQPTSWRGKVRDLWNRVDFWLGVLTTVLVFTAWSTNLVTKPLATIFGGTVAGMGMVIALVNYRLQRQKGHMPVVTTGITGRIPGSVLAVLTARNGHNDMVIRSAINSAEGKPIVFLYVAERKTGRVPRMFEVVDPYLEDQQAKEYFSKAENLANKSKLTRSFVYRQEEPGTVASIWQVVHPRDTVVAAEDAQEVKDVNPDRIRYELVPGGKVAHLLKRW